MTSVKSYYNKQGLWSLYLSCAFPLYFWTLLLSFRDVSWLAERTNSWDAIGVVSYGMVFAFIESVVLFMIAALLGFLISNKWETERRIALLSSLVLIVSLWAIFNQSYFVWQIPIPAPLIQLMLYTKRPVLTLYAILFVLVFISIALPVYFILHTKRGVKFAQDVFERLSLLSALYLVLAFAGLIIVIIRNT